MRNSAHQLTFFSDFVTRPQLECIKIDPAGFDKYNFNTAGFINNLNWGNVFQNRETTTFPDAVAQFYCNLKVSGHQMNGIFTTFVDGYLLSVTPRLLATVLQLPNAGITLMSEAEFPTHGFNPREVLSRWTQEKIGRSAYGSASKLPEPHRILHYLITNVFLPRSDLKFMVTPVDTWIIRSAFANIKLDYCSLMWAHMVRYAAHPSTDALPFANEISTLLVRLGLRLSRRYVSHNLVCRLSAQHVLRTIKWSGCLPKPVTDSGGEKIAVSSPVKTVASPGPVTTATMTGSPSVTDASITK
ncbi:hypothetical protein LINGRAPRIM_LOCUS2006 [Linum grandiflorum]